MYIISPYLGDSIMIQEGLTVLQLFSVNAFVSWQQKLVIPRVLRVKMQTVSSSIINNRCFMCYIRDKLTSPMSSRVVKV